MNKYIYTITLSKKLFGIFTQRMRVFADSVGSFSLNEHLVIYRNYKKDNEVLCEEAAIFNNKTWISVEVELNPAACNGCGKPRPFKKKESELIDSN